jgi:hypothetical protein
MKLTFGVNDGELFVRSVEFGHPQELRFLQRVTLRYRVFEGVLVVSLCASYGNLECLLFSPMTGKEIVADLGKAERKALGIEEVVVVDAQMFEKLVDAAEAEAEQAKLPSGAAPSGGKKPGGKKPAPPAAAEEEDDEDAELEAEEVEGADGEKEDDEWEEVDDDDLEYEDEEEE